MPVLRCTSKLLTDIDDSPLADVTPSTSPLGDWYGHSLLLTAASASCSSTSRRCSCAPYLVSLKADYRDIAPFFREVLAWTLRVMLFPENQVAWIVELHRELTVGCTVNRSTLASLNNRIANAKTTFLWQGGFGCCHLADLTVLLNQTPMKPIGYSNGYEQMGKLVDGYLKPTTGEG